MIFVEESDPDATDEVELSEETPRDMGERWKSMLNTIDAEFNLPAHQYQYWEIDLRNEDSGTDQTRFEYEVDVQYGPEIDVFILNERAFESYEEGDRFLYHELSTTRTRHAEQAGYLDHRTYYLVIDNTTAGEASPNDYSQSDARVAVTAQTH